MAKHGSMGEFFPAREQWDTYIERLQNYFVANDTGLKHLWSYHISINYGFAHTNKTLRPILWGFSQASERTLSPKTVEYSSMF